MDLQGVHPLKDVQQFKWLAQGTPASEQPAALARSRAEDKFKQVVLEPLGLRSFKITYGDAASQAKSASNPGPDLSQLLNEAPSGPQAPTQTGKPTPNMNA